MSPRVLISLLALLFASHVWAATPANPEVQQAIARGDQAVQSHKYDDAIKEYRKANKLSANRCSVCNQRLALVYFRIAEPDQGLDYCAKAVDCASGDQELASAYKLQGDALLAVANGDTKRLKQSETALRNALAHDPSLADAHFLLAKDLFQQKRDADALAELNAFLAVAPSGPSADMARRWQAKPQLARERLAPDFQIVAMDGQTYSLQSLAGKTVVLDFWATWCPACVASLGDMKDLVKKYDGRIVVISVSADQDQSRWRDFIAKKQMTWPQYFDGGGRIAEQFGVHAFPTYMIIDGEGVIHTEIVGTNPQMSLVGRLKKELASLLDSGTSTNSGKNR